jgi:hypothetical protein
MRSAGVEEELIAVADDLHSGTSARVRWRGHRSSEFHTSAGVQQGSAASNPEWNLVADVLTRQIMEAVAPNGGIELYSKTTSRTLSLGVNPLPDSVLHKILMLLLADDIVAFAKSEEELNFLLQQVNTVCSRWGLTVSISKTNILVIAGSDRPPDPQIVLNGDPIPVVEAAKYLGSWYSRSGSIEKEILVRIGQAWGAARKLSPILHSRKVSIKAKLRLYHSLIVPILTYGAESWPLTAALTAKLEYCHQYHLRQILGVRWQDMVSNATVHERLKTISMEVHCRRQRLLWLGHVVRMPDIRLPKILLFGHLTGPRKRGRTLSLRKLYAQDIMKIRGGVPDGLAWYELASDRNIWPKFVMQEPLVQQQGVQQNSSTSGLQTAEAAVSTEGAPGPSPNEQSQTTAPQTNPGPRRSTRIIERMGQSLSNPLLNPLTTSSGQPRSNPSSPYTGRPRGRRLGSGSGRGVYVPTGRARGRPLGAKTRRHGF